jgi:hypothetical protein
MRVKASAPCLVAFQGEELDVPPLSIRQPNAPWFPSINSGQATPHHDSFFVISPSEFREILRLAMTIFTNLSDFPDFSDFRTSTQNLLNVLHRQRFNKAFFGGDQRAGHA